MAEFAEIKKLDNTVLRVVVINDSDIQNKTEEEAEKWVQENISNSSSETYWKRTWIEAIGVPEKRYNGAGPGMIYDSSVNAFYFQEPTFPSYILNTSTYQWDAPVPKPSEDTITASQIIEWNEEQIRWEKKEVTDLNSTYYWDGSQWLVI